VDHFTKKITVQMITDDGLLGLEDTINHSGRGGRVDGHAESVRRRLEPEGLSLEPSLSLFLDNYYH